MKPELSTAYLHTIEADPLDRGIAMSEQAWTETWKAQVKAALDSDLVGDDLYDAWPTSFAIPRAAWEARLKANWARLAEYDRLTALRQVSKGGAA